jgi:L,D-peptidoglycan transpeptidase YkuD (ErfK/YbiS/YcfS/YnhG family)
MATLEVFTHVGSSHATLRFHNREYPALIGEGGPIAPADKREGDGYTPLGRYPLMEGYYRADRGPRPNDAFKWVSIQPGMGWGENSNAEDYNQFQPNDPENTGTIGFWQEGPQRDLIIVIGYNGAAGSGPIVAEKGSAWFIHPTRPGVRASRSCIMLSLEHMHEIAALIQPGDDIEITIT